MVDGLHKHHKILNPNKASSRLSKIIQELNNQVTNKLEDVELQEKTVVKNNKKVQEEVRTTKQ